MPGYSYTGCYTDMNPLNFSTTLLEPQYLLNGPSYTSTGSMTWDSCTSICAPYQYAGIGGGSICRCGDSYAYAPILSNDTLCVTPCTGNPLQFCGGTNLLTVFHKSTASSSSITPFQAPVQSQSFGGSLPVPSHSSLPLGLSPTGLPLQIPSSPPETLLTLASLTHTSQTLFNHFDPLSAGLNSVNALPTGLSPFDPLSAGLSSVNTLPTGLIPFDLLSAGLSSVNALPTGLSPFDPLSAELNTVPFQSSGSLGL